MKQYIHSKFINEQLMTVMYLRSCGEDLRADCLNKFIYGTIKKQNI